MARHGFKVSCVKISVLSLNRRFFITPAFGRFTVLVGKLCASLGSLQAALAKHSFARLWCLGPKLGLLKQVQRFSGRMVWIVDLEYGS